MTNSFATSSLVKRGLPSLSLNGFLIPDCAIFENSWYNGVVEGKKLNLCLHVDRVAFGGLATPSTRAAKQEQRGLRFYTKDGLPRGLRPQGNPNQSTGVCAMADKSLSNPQDNRQLSLWDNTSPFDRIRHIDENGQEYWLARELMPLLEYSSWQKFLKVIGKAQTSCEEGGNFTDKHFGVSSRVIQNGKGRKQEIADFKLSRFAAYLVAMNGDPQKDVIASAQAYFASQTRKQELAEQRNQKSLKDKHQQDVTAYQLTGHSQEWAERRVDSKDSQKNLNSTLYATHVDHTPDYGAIGAIQNKELLGMTKREIADYLGLLPKDEPSYRDRLGAYALDALRQVNFTAVNRMKHLGRELTDDEQQDIVRQVIRMIAPTMRDLAAFVGQDFLSGAPLDDQGKPLIMRNVKLLKGGK